MRTRSDQGVIRLEARELRKLVAEESRVSPKKIYDVCGRLMQAQAEKIASLKAGVLESMVSQLNLDEHAVYAAAPALERALASAIRRYVEGVAKEELKASRDKNPRQE